MIDLLASKCPAGMRVQPLIDSYPSGDEFILVYDVMGKVIPPGKIPLAVGVVVINVETALNIARGIPVTEKFLTVAGAVNNPSTLGVPVGISFAEAIDMAGGANVPDPAALIGGVVMGVGIRRRRAQFVLWGVAVFLIFLVAGGTYRFALYLFNPLIPVFALLCSAFLYGIVAPRYREMA